GVEPPGGEAPSPGPAVVGTQRAEVDLFTGDLADVVDEEAVASVVAVEREPVRVAQPPREDLLALGRAGRVDAQERARSAVGPGERVAGCRVPVERDAQDLAVE